MSRPAARERGDRSRDTSVNGAPLSAAQLLTPDDLAARWQVPRSHVYGLARAGRVPRVRLGRYVRFRLADVELFEADGGSDL